MLDLPDWHHSFWDLANPRQGAKALTEMYGDAAAAAAAKCAVDARSDDRDDDFRFWIAVLARLQAAQQLTAEAGTEISSREDPGARPTRLA